jgi:hypothetical protein
MGDYCGEAAGNVARVAALGQAAAPVILAANCPANPS